MRLLAGDPKLPNHLHHSHVTETKSTYTAVASSLGCLAISRLDKELNKEFGLGNVLGTVLGVDSPRDPGPPDLISV